MIPPLPYTGQELPTPPYWYDVLQLILAASGPIIAVGWLVIRRIHQAGLSRREFLDCMRKPPHIATKSRRGPRLLIAAELPRKLDPSSYRDDTGRAR